MRIKVGAAEAMIARSVAKISNTIEVVFALLNHTYAKSRERGLNILQKYNTTETNGRAQDVIIYV